MKFWDVVLISAFVAYCVSRPGPLVTADDVVISITLFVAFAIVVFAGRVVFVTAKWIAHLLSRNSHRCSIPGCTGPHRSHV
jgi:uncharacterized membrane protein YedE/YeeE